MGDPVERSSPSRLTYKGSRIERAFTAFAGGAASLAGKSRTFVLVCVLILIWAMTGPIFHYSDTWQLVINTTTTIITCMIGFLIQGSTNRDMLALQTKLDELLRIDISDHRRMIGIEHMTLTELEILRAEVELAAQLKTEGGIDGQ